MDDHYFGVIRERIGGFMHDVNIELWKLGVTSKTQHNEAAPAQHEVAPIYEVCQCGSGSQPAGNGDSEACGRQARSALHAA